MSLVCSRPILFNQLGLIIDCDLGNVYSVRPRVTGLVKINKIDMSNSKL